MSRVRSRTMPLIASCLFFANFLFARIELGEGLKCYECLSVDDDRCVNDPTMVNIQDCDGLSGRKTNALTSLIPGIGEGKGVYATGNYICAKIKVIVKQGTKEVRIMGRGCDFKGLTCADIPNVNDCNLWTCDTDLCNSSGTLEIGVISLFLSLLASLLYTK